MISIGEVSSAIDVIMDTSVRAADMEVSLYKIGSIKAGQQIRSKLNYLELYGFILNSINEADGRGVSYETLGITDSSLRTCIDYSYELCTTIFTVDL